jgi:hypothetical protein
VVLLALVVVFAVGRMVRGEQGGEYAGEAWVEVQYRDTTAAATSARGAAAVEERWQPIGRPAAHNSSDSSGSGGGGEDGPEDDELAAGSSGSDSDSARGVGAGGGGSIAAEDMDDDDDDDGGDGTTIVSGSGTSADTRERVETALSGRPKPGSSAAKRAAAAAAKARAQTPMVRARQQHEKENLATLSVLSSRLLLKEDGSLTKLPCCRCVSACLLAVPSRLNEQQGRMEAVRSDFSSLSGLSGLKHSHLPRQARDPKTSGRSL